MQLRQDPKIILFFVILAVAEIYMIGAFGSVEGSHGHNAREFRDTSRGLILVTALAGIFLLPAQKAGAFPIPKLPKLLTIFLGILMAWGLLSIINAKTDQRLFEFIYYPSENVLWEWAPGTQTATTSKGFVAELGIMIAFVLMVAKSTLSNAWKGILGSFALCGIAVTFVGLGHRVFDMEHIYGLEVIKGRKAIELPEYYFAPFVYNANAASFLNLAVAISLGLAFYNHRKNPHSSVYMAWLASAGISAVGVIAAASKAGIGILFLQLICFAIIEAPYIRHSIRNFKHGPPLSIEKKSAIGVILVLLLVFGATQAPSAIKRYNKFFEDTQSERGSATLEGRRIVRNLVWEVSSDQEKIGWSGAGPGAFAHSFPFLITEKESEQITQHWQYAHCDPIQTIFEWGYLGAACWFLIGLGAIVRAATLSWNQQEGKNNAHVFKALTIGLVGMSMHSIFDFPFSVFSIHVMAFAVITIMWTLKKKSSMRAAS